ncbi:MAG: hypothetical protein ACK4VI_04170 [Alphaproteobacteria bacterium]
MTDTPHKQMLYLTLRERDGDVYIIYELEPHYRRQNRRIDTVKYINSHDSRLLLRDDALKDSLGFSLILGLFTNGIHQTDPDLRIWWSQIVYPHLHHGKSVLRLDAEPSGYKPVRQKFCGELLLPTLDYDALLDDESFKRTLAEYVLRYLPISEELCLMHEDLKAAHGRA